MPKIYKSAEVLNELLEKHELSAYKLSKGAKIPSATISEWRNGIHEPRFGTMIKVADYLGEPVEVFADALRKELEDDEASL